MKGIPSRKGGQRKRRRQDAGGQSGRTGSTGRYHGRLQAAKDAANTQGVSPSQMLHLQSIIGNRRASELLVQRAVPETSAITISDIIGSLDSDWAPYPPLEDFLKAIKASSISERQAVYAKAKNRDLIRAHFSPAEARQILGALLKDPLYHAGEMAEAYRLLDPADRDEVNKAVDRTFIEETGVTDKLDWDVVADRPFARRWLRLRDQEMDKRRTALVAGLIREEILGSARTETERELLERLLLLERSTKSAFLGDKSFLEELKGILDAETFAHALMALGRVPPSGNDLKADPDVSEALSEAWEDSLPFAPLATDKDQVSTHNHEEGGWIYMDPMTGAITIKRADKLRTNVVKHKSHVEMSIDLTLPPEVEGSVLVGNFHVHPNSTDYLVGPSGHDWRSILSAGVPGLLRDRDGTHAYGPARRKSWTGPSTYPGE